jgi:hypothetical protein
MIRIRFDCTNLCPIKFFLSNENVLDRYVGWLDARSTKYPFRLVTKKRGDGNILLKLTTPFIFVVAITRFIRFSIYALISEKDRSIFFQPLSNNTSCEFNLSRFLLQKIRPLLFLSFMYCMCDAGIEIEWRIENQIKSNRSNEQKDFFCDCCCILFLSQPRIESFYYIMLE